MAAPANSPGKFVFEPNVPQLIALKFPTGKTVESQFSESKQVLYSLMDGRLLYVSLAVAQSISNLELGNRELFYICMRWNGDRNQQRRYDVWLTIEGEKDRAAKEQPATPVPAVVPARQAKPDIEGWGKFLLSQTVQLIDVYAEACRHAETQGVPPAVVRTLLLSSFINVSKRGGCDA